MFRIISDEDAKKCTEAYREYRAFPLPEGQAAFEVQGAGTLLIGQDESRTGTAIGLPVAASWAKHGYAYGVMDRQELIALRDYINDYLAGTHAVSIH